MGKPSATGQPTRPTQPFILRRSINEKQARSIGFVPWRHLVSACEVKAHLATPWRPLCLAAFGLNLVVVAVLRGRRVKAGVLRVKGRLLLLLLL